MKFSKEKIKTKRNFQEKIEILRKNHILKNLIDNL